MINGSSLQTGLQGVYAGLQSFQQSAQKIASQSVQPEGTDLSELVQASVGLILAEHQVAASAEVVKASDEVLGTLLDTIA